MKREVFSLPIRDIASCQGFDKEIFITPEDGQAILAQIMTVIADIPSNIKFFFELDFLGGRQGDGGCVHNCFRCL